MSDPAMREAFEAWHTRNWGDVIRQEEFILERRFKLWQAAYTAGLAAGAKAERELFDDMLEQVQEFLEQRYGNTLGQDWHDEDAAALGDAIEALRAREEKR